MKRLFSIMLLFSIFALPAFGENDVDWSKPETIDIYEKSLAEYLDFNLNEHIGKANQAYQEGDYETSAQHYLAVLRHDINNLLAMYNLACCYGLLGKEELAAEYLMESVEAGYDNLEHLKQDPDFDKVRDTETFSATVDSIQAKIMEERSKQGKMIRVGAEAYFPTKIYFPDDFDSTKTYTLMVGLHGYGANPDNFVQLWEARDVETDFIYVSPQAPYPFSLGKELGYSWFTHFPEGEIELSRKMHKMTENYVLNVIETFKTEYNIDEVYLTGFSQGAGLTFITGLKNPELFAGIAPFGGWLDTEIITEEEIKMAKAKGLPVFICHGTEDRMVEFDAGVKAKEVLETHDMDVTFYEFEGGHTVPEEGLRALLEWMETQEK